MQMTDAQLTPASAQQVTHWAGGETRQLAIAPVGATLAARDFHWRFSTATVLQSGPFSVFSGYRRYLALRSGAGFQLAVTTPPGPTQQITLTNPRHQACFCGGASAGAQLLDGPVRDINLMLAPGFCGGLQALTLEAGQPQSLQATPAASWLIYADGLNAGATVQVRSSNGQWTLTAGDVLLLPAAACELHAYDDCALIAAWLAANA